MIEQRVSDNDISKRDIPSFIEPRPPLIQNPFMRPRPQKGTNLMEMFEEDSEIDEPELVQVYLRMKPCNTPSNLYEVRSEKCLVTTLDTATAGHGRRTQHNVSRMYTFSKIFNNKCSQKEIFEEVVIENLKKLPDGHSFTLLAYGASGSGKTYTLMGNVGAPGLIPRSLEYLFKMVDAAQLPLYKPADGGADRLGYTQQELELKWVKRLRHVSAPQRDKYRRMSAQLLNDLTTSDVDPTNRTKYYVWVSFVEIYNEAIYDLLAAPDKRTKLRMREDSNGQVYVKGVTQAFVKSGEEAYDVMVAGKHNLVVAATGVHAQSSRSHCIFTITMLAETDGTIRHSCIRLCDLAGCERARATGNTGARMQESRAINSSLLVLERCLRMLRKNQKQGQETIVPYRESKLTRLLGSGLSGAAGEAVSMVVTLNPAPQCAHETKHVLALAAVAQDIQTNNTMFVSSLESSIQETTVSSSSEEVMKLRADNERLHFELAQSQAHVKKLLALMDEKQEQTATLMRELVEEAKDMTRQYYEAQLDALRSEMEDMRHEHHTEFKQLKEKYADKKNKLANAQKEIEHLRTSDCIHEPDGDQDKVFIIDSDDDSDPLNQSLEPVFKKISMNISQAVEIQKHNDKYHNDCGKVIEDDESDINEATEQNDNDKHSEYETGNESEGDDDINDKEEYDKADENIDDDDKITDIGKSKEVKDMDDLNTEKNMSWRSTDFVEKARLRGKYFFKDSEIQKTGDETGNESEVNDDINDKEAYDEVNENIDDDKMTDMGKSKVVNNIDNLTTEKNTSSRDFVEKTGLRGTYFMDTEILKASHIEDSEEVRNVRQSTQGMNNDLFKTSHANEKARGTYFVRKPVSDKEKATETLKARNYIEEDEEVNRDEKQLTQNVIDDENSHANEKARGTYFVRKPVPDKEKATKTLKTRNYIEDDEEVNRDERKLTQHLVDDENSHANEKARGTYFVRNSAPDSSFHDEEQDDVVELEVKEISPMVKYKSHQEKEIESKRKPKKISQPLISRIMKSSGSQSNNSLKEFEQLELASKNCDDSIDRKSYMNVLKKNKKYFDDYDKSNEQIAIPDAEALISSNKTKESVDLPLRKSINESADFEENKLSPDELLVQNPLIEKRTYCDNIGTEPYELVNDVKKIEMNVERSPSIVKDDIASCKPSTMKILLGENLLKNDVLSIKKNEAIVKKRDSIDLFEGTESPLLLKAKDKEEHHSPAIKKIGHRNKIRKSIEMLDQMARSNYKQEIKIEPSASSEVPQILEKLTIDSKECDNKEGIEVNATGIINETQNSTHDNTADKFESIYKKITTERPTQFDLFFKDISASNFNENTEQSSIKSEPQVEENLENNEVVIRNDKQKDPLEDKMNEVLYNLRQRGKPGCKSVLNITDEKKEHIDEVKEEILAKCDTQSKKNTKKNLRLRKQKYVDHHDQEDEEDIKLKDILNLKKEFSDITLGLPALKKDVADIPSPEKLPGEEENLPPMWGTQSCPSKSVTRSRRKLFTPRVEPLDESLSQAEDSNDRLYVPRPSYHRSRRIRRKL